MKTTKEWLQALPEPYRKLALSDLKNNPMRGGCANERHASLARALFDAFYWDESPESNTFWSEIHTQAENGEFDKRDIDCTIPEEEP